MSNNYCQLSALLPVPKAKIRKALSICDEMAEKLENDELEGYCGIKYMRERDNGIWFYNEDNANPNHLEQIATAVIEKLKLVDPFIFSWAYTCDKPRIDEFGGGACVIKLGKPSYWIDATALAQKHASKQ